jgi:hypothetical protein
VKGLLSEKKARGKMGKRSGSGGGKGRGRGDERDSEIHKEKKGKEWREKRVKGKEEGEEEEGGRGRGGDKEDILRRREKNKKSISEGRKKRIRVEGDLSGEDDVEEYMMGKEKEREVGVDDLGVCFGGGDRAMIKENGGDGDDDDSSSDDDESVCNRMGDGDVGVEKEMMGIDLVMANDDGGDEGGGRCNEMGRGIGSGGSVSSISSGGGGGGDNNNCGGDNNNIGGDCGDNATMDGGGGSYYDIDSDENGDDNTDSEMIILPKSNVFKKKKKNIKSKEKEKGIRMDVTPLPFIDSVDLFIDDSLYPKNSLLSKSLVYERSSSLPILPPSFPPVLPAKKKLKSEVVTAIGVGGKGGKGGVIKPLNLPSGEAVSYSSPFSILPKKTSQTAFGKTNMTQKKNSTVQRDGASDDLRVLMTDRTVSTCLSPITSLLPNIPLIKKKYSTPSGINSQNMKIVVDTKKEKEDKHKNKEKPKILGKLVIKDMVKKKY